MTVSITGATWTWLSIWTITRAKLVEKYPEMADVLDREWKYFTEAAAKVNEQIELWVGKDDYLIRQTEAIFQYSDTSLTYAHQVCRYSYPANLVIPSVVDADGRTLPGWYLVTDSAFSIDSMYTTIEPSGEQTRRSDTRIDIANIGQWNAVMFGYMPLSGTGSNWLLLGYIRSHTPDTAMLILPRESSRLSYPYGIMFRRSRWRSVPVCRFLWSTPHPTA